MSDGMHITFDSASFRQFRRNKKQFTEKVLSKAELGLKDSAARIVAKAKEVLTKNRNVATGALRNSGSVRPQVDGTVDAGFYESYAYWIEYGRKSGKMPPVKDILEWIKKKGMADTYSIKTHKQQSRGNDYYERAESWAWAIAKSIQKNGYKAKPFLTPAYLEYNQKVDEIMQKAINEVAENYNGK